MRNLKPLYLFQYTLKSVTKILINCITTDIELIRVVVVSVNCEKTKNKQKCKQQTLTKNDFYIYIFFCSSLKTFFLEVKRSTFSFVVL